MTYRELVIRVPVPVIEIENVKEWINENKFSILNIVKIAIPAVFLMLSPFGTVRPVKIKKVKPQIHLQPTLMSPVVGIGIRKIEIKPAETETADSGNREVAARNSNEERYDLDVDPDLAEKRAVYARVAGVYGISPALLEAVHQVESGKSWGGTRSSSAGATGPMQFLPSTFRHYADAGWDIQNPEHALEAAARLLSANGASEGDVDSALLAYNHSWSYVEHVKRIAESI